MRLQKVYPGYIILLGIVFCYQFSLYATKVKSLVDLCIRTIGNEIVKNTDDYSLQDINALEKELEKISRSSKPMVQKLLHKKLNNQNNKTLCQQILQKVPFEKKKFKKVRHSWALSQDGNFLAIKSGHLPGWIKVFDIKTAKKIFKLSIVSWFNEMVFSPSNQHILTKGFFLNNTNSSARLYNLKTGYSVRMYALNELVPTLFNSDGTKIVLLRKNNGEIWNICEDKLKLEMELKGHKTDLTSAVFSPNDKKIATATSYTIRVWNAINGCCMYLIPKGVELMQFSPNSNMLAGKGLDLDDLASKIFLYNKKVVIDKISDVRSFQFSLDGKKIIVTGYRKVKIWDVKNKELKKYDLMCYGNAGLDRDSTTVSCNGRYLFMVKEEEIDKKKVAYLFDLKTRRMIKTLSSYYGWDVRFYNEKYMAVNKYRDIYLYDLALLNKTYDYFDKMSLSQAFILYQLCSKSKKIQKNKKTILKNFPDFIQGSIKQIRKHKN